MNNTEIYNKFKSDAESALRLRENKEKSIIKVMDCGIDRRESEELINTIMAENVKANKSFGLMAMIIGGIGFLITLFLFLYLDRWYYWVMGASTLALLAGIFDYLWPSPFKKRTTIGEEKPSEH